MCPIEDLLFHEMKMEGVLKGTSLFVEFKEIRTFLSIESYEPLLNIRIFYTSKLLKSLNFVTLN